MCVYAAHWCLSLIYGIRDGSFSGEFSVNCVENVKENKKAKAEVGRGWEAEDKRRFVKC